jgi:hypothetical protein
MRKTFGELQNGELFVVDNAREIISNRGDITPQHVYGDSYSGNLVFQKRDEFGGNILYYAYGNGDITPSVYYRIDFNNPVNIVSYVI